MRLIDADALMQSLGITDMDCDKCAWHDEERNLCKRGGDFVDACCAIEDAPTIDAIDRQAAIRWVKTECNPYGNPTLDFESGKKVIEHLEQMPSAQPTQNERVNSNNPLDCISRQAAIDAVDVSNLHRGIVSALQEIIRELPSAQPERKKGKWIKLFDDSFNCQLCGHTFVVIQGESSMNLCPNCGADMRQ